MTSNDPDVSSLERFARAVVVMDAAMPHGQAWRQVVVRYSEHQISAAEACVDAKRRAHLDAWEVVRNASEVLHTGRWDDVTDLPRALAYASALVGKEREARDLAEILHLPAEERRSLEILFLRIATGLWFVEGDALLRAASAGTTSSDVDENLVTIARRALDEPAIRAAARRELLPLPDHDAVAAVVADAVLADSLADHLAEAERLLLDVSRIIPPQED